MDEEVAEEAASTCSRVPMRDYDGCRYYIDDCRTTINVTRFRAFLYNYIVSLNDVDQSIMSKF